MKKPSLLMALMIVTVTMAFNPGACGKACSKGCGKGCSTAGREAAEHSDELAEASKNTAHVDNIHPDVSEGITSTKADASAEEHWFYQGDRRIDQIAQLSAHSDAPILVSGRLSDNEAQQLLNKGVHFVYDQETHLVQGGSRYKIIYLFSEDLDALTGFYDIDRAMAGKVVEWSSSIRNDDAIAIAENLEDLIDKQNRVIAEGAVPVVIFHNKYDEATMRRFAPSTNFITCNNYKFDSQQYIQSTTFIDLKGVIDAVQSATSNNTLSQFYQSFSTAYDNYLQRNFQRRILFCVGSGLGVAVGVGAVYYYSSSSSTQ